MAKQSQFATEYKSICGKLRGLDPVNDSAAVKQLKNGKAEIVRAWRQACGNNFTFKSELQIVQTEMQADTLTAEDREKQIEAAEQLRRQGVARAKGK